MKPAPGIVFDQIREFGFSISNIANRNSNLFSESSGNHIQCEARSYADCTTAAAGGATGTTARRSRCCTTAPSNSPATPPTSGRCAAINDRRPCLVYCTCFFGTSCWSCSRRPTPWWSPCLAAGGARRQGVGAGGDDDAWDVKPPCRTRCPDPAGPVPDRLAVR